MLPDASSLETAWKRDRAILVAFLLGIGGLAWLHTVRMAAATGAAHMGHAMTAHFLLGYLAIWMAYSGFATIGQWGLHAAALFSPALEGTSPVMGGALLVAAGAYQLTPFRDACMIHCRSPLDFFLSSWKEGRWGAFTMGFRHGLYCLGCCWALMALSFAFGVMNLLWMAGLTAYLLVEKVTSAGPRMSKAAGWLLAGCGLWMLGKSLLFA